MQAERAASTADSLDGTNGTARPAVPYVPFRPSSAAEGRQMSRCPQCGLERIDHATPQEAQQRISELEAQVRSLTVEASGAAARLAYCEENHAKAPTPMPGSRSESVSGSGNYKESKEDEPLPPVPASGESSLFEHRPSTVSRFSSFLGRKRYPQNAGQTSDPANSNSSTLQKQAMVTAREHELAAEVSQERSKRQQAEDKVGQMSAELEELSSTLFQQANEMVATERKARAKLEERVKILEDRDVQKRQRLEILETEMKRIERLRKSHLISILEI